MPVINDNENPAAKNNKFNLVQALNTVAFLLKKIRSENSWKTPASISLAALSQNLAQPGPKGDKGDKGDPARLFNQHEIPDVTGLQTVLNTKASIGHVHSKQAWQNLPCSAGWSNHAVGVATPQYRKLSESLVEVKGTIKKSTAVVANEVIATLPVGYRPSEARFFITWNVNSYSRVQVDSNGSIRVTTAGSNTNVGLDFIFGLN